MVFMRGLKIEFNDMDVKYIQIEWFWDHLSNRTIEELETKCMKRKCEICEFWARRIDLYK